MSSAVANIETNAAALASMAAGDLSVATSGGGSDVVERATTGNAALARFLSEGGRDVTRADRPFEQVIAVNRCIRIRGNALGSMPVMISTRNDELVEAGEIMDVFNQPMPGMTFEDLVQWIDALVMLTGACYCIIEEAIGSAPTQLRPVGHTSCKPESDADGDLKGYWYRKPGSMSGRRQWLDPEQVIPFTLANYQTEKLYDGLSQIEPSRRAIDQVFAADIANLESLHNGCEPGLVFDFGPNTSPTPEQRNDLYAQLDENHRGPDKRQRPIIIGGGAKVSDFVKSFTEMQFSTLKAMSATDVCVSFGVPPLVAGFAGEEGLGHGKEMEEAHNVFWQITALPSAMWIARKLTVHLLPRFQGRARTFNCFIQPELHRLRCPTYRAARRHARSRQVMVRAEGRQPLEFFAWFDSSSVDAVRDSAIRRLKELTILTEKLGSTQADVIEMGDLPVRADHPWQQTWWKPMSLMDVQADTTELEPPAGDDTQTVGDDDAPETPTPEKSKALSESQLSQLHNAWWLSIQPLIGRMRSMIAGHFRDLRRECLANLARLDPAKGIERRDLVARIVFDITAANGRIAAKARPLILQSAMLGGAQSMEDAAVAEGKTPDEAATFNIADPHVHEMLRRREQQIAGVNTTLARKLRGRLGEAIDEGKTISELTDVLREEFDIASNRAPTIARTEIGSVVEAGKHEGRKQAGIPLKSWLWSRKETGRPWHMAAEQETSKAPIAVDALFTLPQTGNTCQHPRATGQAKDDINCGCTTLSRYPDAAKDARLTAHRLERGFLSIDQLQRRMGGAKEAA